MRNPNRAFQWIILFIAIEVTVIVVGLCLARHSDAHSRPIPESSCQRVWLANEPGVRWPAKVACIKRVRAHNCRHVPRYVPGSVLVKGKRVDTNQRKVLSWVISEGLRRRSNRTIMLSAIAATTQEASARELAGGDWTSAGPFQLTHFHGSLSERRSVAYSSNWYFNHAERAYYRGISINDLAQAVEISGHPYLYGQWVPEARRTLKSVARICLVARG